MKTSQFESLTGMQGAVEAEGARKATVVSTADAPSGTSATVPDPEASGKPKRRRFTAEYKRKILKQADACTRPGELGALLRREGVYSSSLNAWRAARDRGELAGLAPRKRGPKAAVPDARDRELAAKDREIARLSARAERAEALIEVQKKLSRILGIRLPDSDDKP